MTGYAVCYAHKPSGALDFDRARIHVCFSFFFAAAAVASKYKLEPRYNGENKDEFNAWFFAAIFSEAPKYIKDGIEFIEEDDGYTWVHIDRTKLNAVETFAVLTLCRYVRDKVEIISEFRKRVEESDDSLSTSFYLSHSNDENSGHSVIAPRFPYRDDLRKEAMSFPTFEEGWENLHQFVIAPYHNCTPGLWDNWTCNSWRNKHENS